MNKRIENDTKGLIRRIIATLLQGVFFLFIIIIITFMLRISIQDQIYVSAAFYPPEIRNVIVMEWGLDQPIINQFGIYIQKILTGDWGEAYSGRFEGYMVTEWLKIVLLRGIEVIFLPLILGILIGVLLGKISAQKKGRWEDKLIQILSYFGIAVPVVFLALVLQSNSPLLPISGYNDMSLQDPPFLTGIRTIDSLFTGNFELFFDAIKHLILPGIVLTVIISGIITILTKSTTIKGERNLSINSITYKTGLIYVIGITGLIITERTFNMFGIGFTISYSFVFLDYLMYNGSILLIAYMFIIISVCTNISYAIYKFIGPKIRKEKNESDFEVNSDKIDKKIYLKNKYSEKTQERKNSIQNLQEFTKNLLKSPSILIGIVICIFILVTSIFAPLLTPYTIEELTTSSGWGTPFAPPSPEHPLGTTINGYDLYGSLVYGTRNLLLSSSILTAWTILLGTIVGLIVGIIEIYGGKHGKTVGKILIWPTNIFFMLLGLFFPLAFIYYPYINFLKLFVFIPISSRIFRNGILAETPQLPNNSQKKSVLKNILVKYTKTLLIATPILLGISIIYYSAVGYGFEDQLLPDLGNLISWGESRIESLPGLSLWPGFYMFLASFGFISLGFGLKSNLPEIYLRMRKEENKRIH